MDNKIIEIVSSSCPEQLGCKRHIKPLWGSTFRVNWYNPEERKIVKSVFVEVKDGKVILN